jgi:cell division protein FtsQ
MRSVKRTRAQRSDARRKPERRSARPSRPAAAERSTFGKRKRNDPFSLTVARVHRWVAFGRPMLWLTGLLLLSVLVTGVFAGGHVRRAVNAAGRAVDIVVADAGFGISSVQLGGNHRTQPAEILSALGFQPGESIFAADVLTARTRLMALPWVFDAEVRRQYPDSISVDIVERLPFALWQASNGLYYVVDRAGRTITVAQVSQFPHLPQLGGEGAPEAASDVVDAVALHRAVSARLKSLQRMSGRRWNLVLDGDVTVQLPEDGWQSQLDVLEHLIVDKGVLERDISEIDLRERDNVFFVLRDGQKQQSTRGNAA